MPFTTEVMQDISAGDELVYWKVQDRLDHATCKSYCPVVLVLCNVFCIIPCIHKRMHSFAGETTWCHGVIDSLLTAWLVCPPNVSFDVKCMTYQYALLLDKQQHPDNTLQPVSSSLIALGNASEGGVPAVARAGTPPSKAVSRAANDELTGRRDYAQAMSAMRYNAALHQGFLECSKVPFKNVTL